MLLLFRHQQNGSESFVLKEVSIVYKLLGLLSPFQANFDKSKVEIKSVRVEDKIIDDAELEAERAEGTHYDTLSK